MRTIWGSTSRKFEVDLDSFTQRIRWIGLALALVLGNWSIQQSTPRVGFHIILGVALLYTLAMQFLQSSHGRWWALSESIALPELIIVTAFCYFTGGAVSPFRYYYIPLILLCMRYGARWSLFASLTAIVLYTVVGLIQRGGDLNGSQLILSNLVFLSLPFVSSPLVGPRIHAIARSNARRVHQTEQSMRESQGEIDRLQALNELSKSLIGPLRQDEWLDNALMHTATLFSADAAWVYDYDESRPEEERLHLLASYGIRESSLAESEMISLQHGVTGQAVLRNQMETLQGRHDERIERISQFPFAPPSRGFPFRIAVPLVAHGHITGVLTLVNQRHITRTAGDMEFIRTVANQIAIAVDNARLYSHERQRRAYALVVSEITKAIHFGLEFDEVIRRISHELRRILHSDLCQIWLMDAEKTTLTQQEIGEAKSSVQQVAIADIPMFELAVQDGKAVYTMYTTEDQQFARKLGMHSLIVLPLVAYDGIIGCILIGYRSEVHFRSEIKELIGSLGEQIAASLNNVQLHHSIRQELKNRSILYGFMRKLNLSTQLSHIVDCFFVELHQLFAMKFVTLWKFNEDLNALEMLASDGLSGTEERDTAAQITDIEECWAIKQGNPFLAVRGTKSLHCCHLLQKSAVKSHVCLPLTAQGRTLGAVQIGVSETLTPDQVRLLEPFCEQLALAIHRVALHEQIRNLADRDPLTEIYNYGYFQKQLAHEISRAERRQEMLSLLYLDIDHFKQFNDTFGHPMGDQLLRRFARVLNQNVRAVDLVARLGGEEFAVLLPNTSKTGAVILAEKLRGLIERTEFIGNSQQPTVHKTVSIGVATYLEDAADGDDLIRKADEALYKAKAAGRNQVATV